MAKQVGPLFVTGTIDGVIFYKLGDTYYMRGKGDYRSGKQMRRDPRLKRTMQRADQFGEASKLVKPVYYRQLPKAYRKHGMFGKLTGMVNQWLYQDKTKEEAETLLIAYCKSLGKKTETAPTTSALVKPLPVATKEKTSMPRVEAKRLAVPNNRKLKKARYLSKWKVKRNGRLHIPGKGSFQNEAEKICLDPKRT